MELMQHLDRLGVSRPEQLVTGCSTKELLNLKKELTQAMKTITGRSLEDLLKQRQISDILEHTEKTLAELQAKENSSGEDPTASQVDTWSDEHFCHVKGAD